MESEKNVRFDKKLLCRVFVRDNTRQESDSYFGHVSILTPLNAALVKLIGTPSVVSMM